MGKAIPYDLRVKIVRDHQRGQSHAAIAAAIGCSREAVKKLLRQYRQSGDTALRADYSACGRGRQPGFDAALEAEVLSRKDALPGSEYVFSVLREAHPGQHIPSARTIRRRWAKAGNPRTPRRRTRVANTWTKEVHHTWQIDGKEQITLASGEQVSWVNIADEASSTALYTGVFPPTDDGGRTPASDGQGH